MKRRISYQLTNVFPFRIFSLDWIPRTLVIDNTSPFPIYVNIGSVATPTIKSASDIMPPFMHYSVDTAGAHEFAIFIDNSSDVAQVFPFPVVVTFLSGFASQQSYLSLASPESS